MRRDRAGDTTRQLPPWVDLRLVFVERDGHICKVLAPGSTRRCKHGFLRDEQLLPIASPPTSSSLAATSPARRPRPPFVRRLLSPCLAVACTRSSSAMCFNASYAMISACNVEAPMSVSSIERCSSVMWSIPGLPTPFGVRGVTMQGPVVSGKQIEYKSDMINGLALKRLKML